MVFIPAALVAELGRRDHEHCGTSDVLWHSPDVALHRTQPNGPATKPYMTCMTLHTETLRRHHKQ